MQIQFGLDRIMPASQAPYYLVLQTATGKQQLLTGFDLVWRIVVGQQAVDDLAFVTLRLFRHRAPPPPKRCGTILGQGACFAIELAKQLGVVILAVIVVVPGRVAGMRAPVEGAAGPAIWRP